MGLSVIGAGFGRTGTESMKTALEMLGIGPCLHMKVILADPAQEAYWRTILEDDQQGKSPDWDEAYQDWQSGVDWPTAYYWRELSDYYPDAKVLLTVRDAESWYESIAKTILKILEKLTDPDSIGLKMISEGVFHGRLDDREYAIDLYEKHNAAVREAIAPDRLLEYNLGDGWDPLCSFLGKPIPAEPYPQSNDGEEFHTFFDKRLESD
jgi:hypothetical protein